MDEVSGELVISIVNWNTRELLNRCLKSLCAYCRPGHTRIIVVDNASSDHSPDMVREQYQSVTLIESGGNLGFGRAHNLVAAVSEEPFVLFLNPDTEFTSNTHEQMLQVFKLRADVGAVGCRLCNLDGRPQPLGIQWNTSPLTELVSSLLVSNLTMPLARKIVPYQDPLQDGYVRKLYGACLMLRRAALDRVGWFDERFFMYAEDVDLSRRIEADGWRLYHLGSSSVVHLGGGASERAPGRFAIVMQCDSISKLMDKYYSWPGRVVYVCIVFVRSLARLAAAWMSVAILSLIGCHKKSARWIDSYGKNVSILKWSTGLTNPVIPK